jgi:hypothetical protein
MAEVGSHGDLLHQPPSQPSHSGYHPPEIHQGHRGGGGGRTHASRSDRTWPNALSEIL